VCVRDANRFASATIRATRGDASRASEAVRAVERVEKGGNRSSRAAMVVAGAKRCRYFVAAGGGSAVFKAHRRCSEPNITWLRWYDTTKGG